VSIGLLDLICLAIGDVELKISSNLDSIGAPPILNAKIISLGHKELLLPKLLIQVLHDIISLGLDSIPGF
jgi:hypothetical protein